MASTTPLVTMHLFGVPGRRVPQALARMAGDRGPLSRTRGLRFFKLVGTGRGETFTVTDADPLRWGLIAAWEHADDFARFERTSVVAGGWSRLSSERWRAVMVPLRSRGSWSRQDPFAPPRPPAEDDGPLAVLTRARIRSSQAVRFWRSVPPVSASLHQSPGLRFSVGFGEAPIGVQGTFSVWESPRAVAAFAYGGQPHRAAIADTARLQWYGEELFARFAIVSTEGTVNGRDPLTGGDTRA